MNFGVKVYLAPGNETGGGSGKAKESKNDRFSERTGGSDKIRTLRDVYRSGLTTGFIFGIQGALISANKNGENRFTTERIKALIMPIAKNEIKLTNISVNGADSVEFVAVGKVLLNELNNLTAKLARGEANNEDVVNILVKLNSLPKVSEKEILAKTEGKPVFVMGKGADPKIKVRLGETELKPEFDMPKGSKAVVKLTSGSYTVEADGTRICSIACTSIDYQGIQAVFKVDVLNLLH